MKKSFIFGLFATTIGAVAAGLVISNSGVAIGGFAGGDSQAIWKHYAQKDATATEKGIREYWIECDGDYQFTAPQGVTVVEGTAYDTSEFTQDDPRWLTYVSGSVFYNMATSAYDYREVGTALDGYAPFNEVDKTTYGAKLNAVYTKAGSPSLMVEQLTVTKVLTTAADVLALNVKENGTQWREDGAKEIVGYYVLGQDISNVSSNVGWNDACHGNRFIGTLDGRGHKISTLSVWSSAGLFGARTCGEFVIKDITLEGCLTGSYGLFGYMVDNLTLRNVKITQRNHGGNTPAASIFANTVTNIKCYDCYFDTSITKKPLIDNANNPTFSNTKYVTDFHTYKLFNQLNGAAYTETYNTPGISYVCSTYYAVAASPATYEHGGHEAGYYCEVCDKFFEDANHQTQMAVTDPLPSTKVVGKQIFWNLATSAFDVAEVPGLDTTKLVAGDGSALSFTGAKAGDVKRTFLPGETTYEYELVVVTDVIAQASDFASKLDAGTKDLEGYFVMTADMDVVNTTQNGSNTAATSVKVTLDCRKHTINTLVIKNSTAGFFGSLGASGHDFNVILRNLTAKKVSCAAYGMFGWGPTSNGASHSLLLENCDLTAGGNSNRYGLIGHDARSRISLKNCIFDFSKNDFSGGQEVCSGSFLFCAGGSYPVMEDVTMIIIEAHDTYKNNYTEGSTTYTDVIKPDAVIGGKSASERTGLVSKMAGLTFLTARA